MEKMASKSWERQEYIVLDVLSCPPIVLWEGLRTPPHKTWGAYFGVVRGSNSFERLWEVGLCRAEWNGVKRSWGGRGHVARQAWSPWWSRRMLWSQRPLAHWPWSHPWNKNRAVSVQMGVVAERSSSQEHGPDLTHSAGESAPLPVPGRDSFADQRPHQRERPGGNTQGWTVFPWPPPQGAADSAQNGCSLPGGGTSGSQGLLVSGSELVPLPRLIPTPPQSADQRGNLEVRWDMHCGPQ